MHLLTWPKARRLAHLSATVSPGRLLLTAADGSVVLDCQDPDELRSFAMQVHAAAVDRDLAVQAEAAQASAARRLRRQQRGEVVGHRSRPFTDVPEPPMHMEVPA